MTKALIFEVGEAAFSQSVLENSHKLPVLVEFMNVWSEPCAHMTDSLHHLATEFPEQFVFAKIDVDEQPELCEQFNIQHTPTLLVFQQGRVAFTQEGQMQEQEIRLLLKGLGVYRESDVLCEQARDKHLAGDTPQAILLLTQAIKQDPTNTRIAMSMVQIFIDIGELEQAKGLFNKLPPLDKESTMGKSLTGQLTFADLAAKTPGIEHLTTQVAQHPNDHSARFDLALCLIAHQDHNGGIDQLLTLLKNQPDYKNGAAKEMIITIANMLAPNQPEQARLYRQQLANLTNG